MNLLTKQQINESFFPGTDHKELTAPEILEKFHDYHLDLYFLRFIDEKGWMGELFKEVKMNYVRCFRSWFEQFTGQTQACPNLTILKHAATIGAFEYVKRFCLNNERRVFEIERTILKEKRKLEDKLKKHGNNTLSVRLEDHSGEHLNIIYQVPNREKKEADPEDEYMDFSFLEYLLIHNRLEECLESMRTSGVEYCQKIYGGYVKMANRRRKKVRPFHESIEDLQAVIESDITYPELIEILRGS